MKKYKLKGHKLIEKHYAEQLRKAICCGKAGRFTKDMNFKSRDLNLAWRAIDE